VAIALGLYIDGRSKPECECYPCGFRYGREIKADVVTDGDSM